GSADPREGDDVGHAVFVAGEPMHLFETMVQYPGQAFHLVRVALDRIGDFFWSVGAEMVPLAEHRADAAHLEHYPFEAFVAAEPILRDQFATSLFREINQDRRRFKERERLAARAVGVDDRRNAVVCRDLQELRLELVAGANIDRDRLEFESHFFERNVHFVPIAQGVLRCKNWRTAYNVGISTIRRATKSS